jgi:NAD-dependent SIR2 family protein deacetylase
MTKYISHYHGELTEMMCEECDKFLGWWDGDDPVATEGGSVEVTCPDCKTKRDERVIREDEESYQRSLKRWAEERKERETRKRQSSAAE